MSAATAARTRTFFAKRDSLILTKRGIRNVRGPEGELIDREPGEKLQFVDGRLDIPLEGDVTMADGRTIPAADVLDWIARHPMLGNREEGFWEFELPAPEPSQEELDQLTALAIDHDLEGLLGLQASEEAGWKRPKLLEVLKGTIKRVEAATAAQEPAGE